MFKVGLTGGIGSGKSTVAKVFEHLSIPVYYADERSKAILHNDQDVISRLIALFGKEIYVKGQLQNAVLAQKVFHNKEALTQLNAIVHPAVAEDFEQWCTEQSAVYVLKEAAILFEIGSYKNLDSTVLVSAEKELRLQRVMERNQVSKEEVLARMDKQWEDEQKIPLADFVIYNNQKDSLIKQVLAIHENLIGRANKGS